MDNLKQVRKMKMLARQNQLKQQRSDDVEELIQSRQYAVNRDLDDLEQRLGAGGVEDYFNLLSDELVLHIFKFIPRKVLLKYAVVCKRWRALMLDEFLWTSFDFSNRNVNCEVLIRLLNKGVRVLGMAHANILKSTKKYIIQNDPKLRVLSNQLDYYLNEFIKLEYLDLTNSSVDIESLNSLLRHCRSLKKLSLESIQINNETCVCIAQNKSMDTLDLCQTRDISIEGLIVILENLRQLKNVNLAWTNLSRESVVILCRYLTPTVQRLNLSGCKTTLLDSDIDNLTNNCANLIELDVSDAASLTKSSVEMISERLNSLEMVSFSRCYAIMPSSFTLLGRLSSLHTLDLFNIVRDKSFDLLKQTMPSLKHINKQPFTSIALPTNGRSFSTLWGYRVTQSLGPNRK